MARNNDLDPVEVGQRIHDRRLELELSQRELDGPGVTFAYISRVENGSRAPSLSALVVLAGRMREHAAAEITRLEAVDGAPAKRTREKRLAELRQIEADTTGLYLLTGSAHEPCPFCGRHENGDTTDGKGRPRRH